MPNLREVFVTDVHLLTENIRGCINHFLKQYFLKQFSLKQLSRRGENGEKVDGKYMKNFCNLPHSERGAYA